MIFCSKETGKRALESVSQIAGKNLILQHTILQGSIRMFIVQL